MDALKGGRECITPLHIIPFIAFSKFCVHSSVALMSCSKVFWGCQKMSVLEKGNRFTQRHGLVTHRENDFELAAWSQLQDSEVWGVLVWMHAATRPLFQVLTVRDSDGQDFLPLFGLSAPCEFIQRGTARRVKPIQADMVLARCSVIFSTASSTFISSNGKCQTN